MAPAARAPSLPEPPMPGARRARRRAIARRSPHADGPRAPSATPRARSPATRRRDYARSPPRCRRGRRDTARTRCSRARGATRRAPRRSAAYRRTRAAPTRRRDPRAPPGRSVRPRGCSRSHPSRVAGQRRLPARADTTIARAATALPPPRSRWRSISRHRWVHVLAPAADAAGETPHSRESRRRNCRTAFALRAPLLQ